MQIAEDYIPFKCEFIDDISRVDESAQSEVAKSGGTILAIVKGQHFCPGKVSRNHRLYTPELWEEAGKDEDVQRKLTNGQMFGRIGHEAEITDEDIADGKFSHITRNIDWKTGIAESVIYNTDMGKTLYTILRAGTTMFVSSRADGDYEGKDEDGNDILDPKTYKLERFDFVQDPGFLDAKPKMISESKQNEKVEEAVKERVAESLLSLAKELGAPVELDGSTYIVESLENNTVEMTDCDKGTGDTYKFEDFTEVNEDIKQSIVKFVEGLQEEVKQSADTIRDLKFANKNGLNEAYVTERRRAGATYEAIEREQPETQTFKVLEAKAPAREAEDNDGSLIGYILGSKR
ncbi:MAG: hypothetical protein IKT27_03805 [Clostridia bacterium]|nr:hypothetical protein [Clostridia bacterium]